MITWQVEHATLPSHAPIREGWMVKQVSVGSKAMMELKKDIERMRNRKKRNKKNKKTTRAVVEELVQGDERQHNKNL
jgi:hypothetical protein